MDLAFLPSGDRAVAMDGLMRGRLADSFEAIQQAAGSEPSLQLDLANVIRGLRGSESAPPALWAVYGDLCRAVARDDLDAVQRLGARLQTTLGHPSRQRLCNLTDEDLGAGGAELFANAIDDDPSLPLNLGPADRSEMDRLADLLPSALSLLRDASPDLFKEIAILTRQIVLASSPPGSVTFSGAATLFLWGAILLNPEGLTSRLKLVEAIVHESAHALLTGLTGGIDVTTNDADQLFASPLRADPRPMEGIAHAAFVLARINFALDRIAHSCVLSRDEQDELRAMQAENRRFYAKAEEVVRTSASFTPAGAIIFENCFAAMRDAREMTA